MFCGFLPVAWPIRPSPLLVCALSVLLASCAKTTPSAAPMEPVAEAAQASDPELSLDESTRQYLWKTEHHGNLLSQRGWKAVGDAIRWEDPAALREILAEDFRAEVPDEPPAVVLTDGAVRGQRWERSAPAGRDLGRESFVEWLVEHGKPFDSARVSFGVMAISPDSADDLEGAWHGRARMTIQGESSDGAPGEVRLTFGFRVACPTRERLAEAGWWLACTIEEVAVVGSDSYLFREVAAERGLDPGRLHDNWNQPHKTGHTGGAYACDFNADGLVDLLITDYGPPGIILYKGLPDGRFEDVTRQVGLAGPSGRPPRGFTGVADICAVADLDNDGWEDLITTTGGAYRNLEGREFVFAAHASNLFSLIYAAGAPRNPPTAILPADYDRDGLVDLYVVRAGFLDDPEAGWIDEEPSVNAGNQLLRNLGRGQFEDVTAASGTEGGGRSVFTAVWLDVNNDLWPDIYMIHEFGKGLLLVNRGNGRFTEHELTPGLGDFGSMGLTCGDVDNDGRIDIYSANMYSKAGNRVMTNLPPGTYAEDVMAKLHRLVAGSRLYRNRGDLRFEEVGRAWQVHDVGWAWGASLADLDNDGWLDLYATAGYMSRDRTKPDG